MCQNQFPLPVGTIYLADEDDRSLPLKSQFPIFAGDKMTPRINQRRESSSSAAGGTQTHCSESKTKINPIAPGSWRSDHVIFINILLPCLLVTHLVLTFGRARLLYSLLTAYTEPIAGQIYLTDK